MKQLRVNSQVVNHWWSKYITIPTKSRRSGKMEKYDRYRSKCTLIHYTVVFCVSDQADHVAVETIIKLGLKRSHSIPPHGRGQGG